MSRIVQYLPKMLLCTLVACGTLWAARPAAAQLQGAPADKSWSTALSVVPENALGFLVLRNMGDADTKVTQVVKNLQIPPVGGLAMIKSLTGVREGLDEKGAAIVVLLPGNGTEAQGQPSPVVLIPVTDYAKFIGQFAPTDAKADVTAVQVGPTKSIAGKRDNFAVFAPAGKETQLRAYLKATQNAATAVAPMSRWFGEHDLIAVAMPSAIKLGVGPIRQGLEQAKKQFPADNEQAAMVMGMFDTYDRLLSTVESDVTHLGFGLRIDDNGGVFANSYSALKPDGKLAKAAAQAKRPADSALSQLGAAPFMMAFEGVFPEGWTEGLMKFSANSMKMMAKQSGGKELTEADLQKLTKAMQQSMVGVQSMGFLVGNFKPGESIYDTMSAVIKVENSESYLKNYELSLKEMSDLFKDSGNKLFTAYEVEKVTVAGVSALAMTMDMSSILQTAGQDPNAKRMMELMFGKEAKITAYVGPADKTTVVMAYNKENFGRTLESARAKSNSLANDAAVAKTLKLLPSESQWVALVSPAGVFNFGMSIAQTMAPPGQIPQLPAFPQTPAIGFGAKLSSAGLETSMVVPAETMQGIGGYVQQVRAMMMRGPGGAPGAPGARPGLRPGL